MTQRSQGVRPSDEWVGVAETKLGVGFWGWDIASERLHCSAGLYALVGVSPATHYIDLAFIESLVHPKDRLAVSDQHGFALDPRLVDRRFRIIRPDGQLRHLRCETTRLFDREGKSSRVVAVVSDITEEEETVSRLASYRALLQNVAQLIESVLWIADANGGLVERFSGYPLAGHMEPGEDVAHWRANLHPQDFARLPGLWQDTVRHGKPFRFSPRVRLASGQYHQFHVDGLPFPPELFKEPHYGGISARTPLATDSLSLNDDLIMTSAQVRACRAMLDWTAMDLAANAGVSLSTVRRIESAETPNGQADSLRLVVSAFRQAGLVIWRGNDGRFCVSDLA